MQLNVAQERNKGERAFWEGGGTRGGIGGYACACAALLKEPPQLAILLAGSSRGRPRASLIKMIRVSAFELVEIFALYVS